MLALDLAVGPVLPTVFRLLDAIALGRFQRLLEGLLQIRPEHIRHIAANQRRRGPAAGEHHTLGINHEDIPVLIDELALAAERGEGLVAIVVVVGQGLFQQGDGGLAVSLFRLSRLNLAQAHQQHAA
ncbi:hypothetical protein D3C73_882970 [compost metagenome]